MKETTAFMRRIRLLVVSVSVLAAIGLLSLILLLPDGKESPSSGTPAGGGAFTGTAATLADYWDGQASWRYLRKDTEASTGVKSFFDGTQLKIVQDGTWYLFNRKILASDEECSSPLETQVRKSNDKGESWSEPIVIIPHVKGTAYACQATDGDVWFNEKENRWHYLFQCHDGSSSGWKGCLLSREGADPMGPFTIEPPGGNPVVSPGELWNAICDDLNDDCSSLSFGPGRVFDEGTFDIFDYDGTYYWVAFHGFDSAHGFRGAAKTADFQNWIAGDPGQGVPADALHDLNDSASWREEWASPFGNTGAGAGAMMKEGEYYYHLVEASDVNLTCNFNQNWNYGLYRSESLTNTKWEQFPAGNPIIYSSRAKEDPDRGILPCNVQYAGLAQDGEDGFIYLYFGRRSNDPEYDGLYWYRLEHSANLLANGDLWRADTEGWVKRGDALTISAPRLPNRSADGTPYLELLCGGSCDSDSGVHQEVSLPSQPTGDTLHFGGAFMSERRTGELLLTVKQLDGKGKTVRTDKLKIGTETSWQTFDKSAKLSPKAERLQYAIAVRDGTIAYRADDLYVHIQSKE